MIFNMTGGGSGESILISDTTDSHGGTIRTITGKVVKLTTKNITQNGTYDAEDDGYDGYSTVTVNAGGSSPTIQSLSVTPTTSQQTFNSSSVDGYKPVIVAAMPTGSVTAPSSISGTSATVSTGTNTLTLTKTVSVTPSVTTAGYISAGTAGNSSVSLTASVTTKAAATITPGTSNQTIASGTYLTGTQTISGDADLVAGNIKKGVQIFGVTGTYEGSGGGSDKNIQVYMGADYARATSYTATDVSITVSKSGTYTVSWIGWRSTSSGTSGSQLYINGSAYGSAYTTFTGTYGQSIKLTNVSLDSGDVLVVRARARSSSYYMYVGNLIIEEQ